jgi:hypothetical protein
MQDAFLSIPLHSITFHSIAFPNPFSISNFWTCEEQNNWWKVWILRISSVQSCCHFAILISSLRNVSIFVHLLWSFNSFDILSSILCFWAIYGVLYFSFGFWIFPWFPLGVSIIFLVFYPEVCNLWQAIFFSIRSEFTHNDSSWLFIPDHLPRKNSSNFPLAQIWRNTVYFKTIQDFWFLLPEFNLSFLSPFSGSLSPHGKWMRSISRAQIW